MYAVTGKVKNQLKHSISYFLESNDSSDKPREKDKAMR